MPRSLCIACLFATLLLVPACRLKLASPESLAMPEGRQPQVQQPQVQQPNDRVALVSRLQNMELRLAALEQDINEARQGIGLPALAPREYVQPAAPIFVPDVAPARKQASPSPLATTKATHPDATLPVEAPAPANMPDEHGQDIVPPLLQSPLPPLAPEYPYSAPDNDQASLQDEESSLPPPSGQQQPKREEEKKATAASSPKALYESALSSYHKGQYEKAQKAFAAFIEQHSGNALVPDALYWRGECLYSLGRYEQAIFAFRDVASKYPRHGKTPTALLKAGHAYAELKDMGNARFYWQLLVDDYPASASAGLARELLAAGPSL